jgi:hypothetical protein
MVNGPQAGNRDAKQPMTSLRAPAGNTSAPPQVNGPSRRWEAAGAGAFGIRRTTRERVDTELRCTNGCTYARQLWGDVRQPLTR